MPLTPSTQIGLPSGPAALDNRAAFLFGTLCVFVLGAMLRVPRFADPWAGVIFWLIADTLLMGAVVANQRIQVWTRSALPRAAGVAVTVGSIVISALVLARSVEGMALIHPALRAPYGNQFLLQSTYFALVLLAWTFAANWLHAKSEVNDRILRAATAERAAAEAEMRRLRLQLDPHFLFNSLNTIAVEVHDRPRRALLLLRELSQYLRYSLDHADTTLVPVAAEIAALRCFLRVQQIRFGSKLSFKLTQEGTVRGMLVPAFLIQPLVDNAAKHGTPDEKGILRITIAVTQEGETQLKIGVTNTGDLLSQVDRPGTGTGLANLIRRLELHYPGRHHFALIQDGALVRAELRLEGQAC